MALQAIRSNVYEVGSTHSDRLLYGDFMPLPEGTTYNAYMVVGTESSALIDLVPLIKSKVLIENIKDSELADPDYIVLLRAQEDYAEPLPELLHYFPNAKIVCSRQLKEVLLEQVALNESVFLLVEDGDTLELGGKTLSINVMSFAHQVFLRSVYLEEDGLLFSGFIFSAHNADENIFANFGSEELIAAKRYYASQVMPFSKEVEAFVDYWAAREVNLIAPAHGPVWQDPKFIINTYKNWMNVSAKNEIVIAYVSLYKHTRELVEKLLFALVRRGYSVVLRELSEKPTSLLAESSAVLLDLVQASTLIIASTTYLGEPHPAASYLAMLVNMMKPRTAFFGFAGSKVGVSHTAERLGNLLHLPTAERLDDLFIEGKIDRSEQALIDEYVDKLAEKISASES